MGFSAIQLILHFALFVMACIEMDGRRRHGRKIVYLVAAPDPADAGLFYNCPARPLQENMESVPLPQLAHRHQ